MTVANDMHRGMAIMLKNQLYIIKDFQSTMPGKGGAFIQATIKSPKTGKIINQRFRSSENIDVAFVATNVLQFLYKDDSGFVFMDTKTYEQLTLQEDLLGNKAKFLIDALEVKVTSHEGEPISVTLPSTIDVTVTFAPPGEKGDTATNTFKAAETDAGFELQVPLFIKTGDKVSVNTDTGEYSGKAN